LANFAQLLVTAGQVHHSCDGLDLTDVLDFTDALHLTDGFDDLDLTGGLDLTEGLGVGFHRGVHREAGNGMPDQMAAGYRAHEVHGE
jgi:hypothetical protein